MLEVTHITIEPYVQRATTSHYSYEKKQQQSACKEKRWFLSNVVVKVAAEVNIIARGTSHD